MKVLQLQVSNFKRITAVDIKPTGNVVEIAGRNAQGKTSTLDALWVLFAGKAAIPAEPVRDGADKAVIEADIGDYIIRRTIRPDREGTITISNKDGMRASEPQKVLNDLIGDLSFDPLLFMRLKPADQLDQLRAFAKGVDFTALDKAYDDAFETRRDVNREVKSLQAIVDAAPAVSDADELVDVTELTDRLNKAHARNTRIRDVLAKRKEEDAEAATEAERLRNNIKRRDALIAEVEALDDKISDLQAYAAEHEARVAKRQAAPDLEPVDDITKQLQDAQRTNAERAAVAGKLEAAKIDRERLTKKKAEAERAEKALTDADDAREAALKAIKLPVKGLSMTPAGILFDGHPLTQASFAQQLQLGIALAMAANPKLRVARILEASMLDDDAMATVHQMAAEHDFQVWIERVGAGGEDAIVIEAGSVKGAPEKPAEMTQDEVEAATKRAKARAAAKAPEPKPEPKPAPSTSDDEFDFDEFNNGPER